MGLGKRRNAASTFREPGTPAGQAAPGGGERAGGALWLVDGVHLPVSLGRWEGDDERPVDSMGMVGKRRCA